MKPPDTPRLGPAARLVAAVVLACVCGCTRLERHADGGRLGAEAEESEAELERRVQAAAHFAAGVSAELNEDPEAAIRHYLRSAETDPAHERLVLELGRRMLRSNEPDRAVTLLEAATAGPGASGEVWALLGRAYAEAGREPEALQANERAIAAAPRSLSGYRNQYIVHREARRWEEAVAVLDRAMAQSVDAADYWVSLAELYANLGQLRREEADLLRERSLKALDRAAALQSPDLSLLVKLADGYKLLGEYRRAEPLYHELIDRCPPVMQGVMQLREKLAQVYVMTDRRSEAEAELRRALADNPRNVPALQFLATLASQQGRRQEAIDYLQQVLVIRPDAEEAYYDLAGELLANDDAAAAVALMEKVRQRFPGGFNLEYFTGVALSAAKRPALAAHHFAQAEALAAEGEGTRLTHIFYFQYGAALERSGDFARAEKYLRKCLELSPDFDEALNYLGYMWADRGENLEEARRLIERAVKAEPDNPAYLDSLGWVFYRLGNHEEARRWLKRAVEKSEEPDATVLDHLGDACAALGDREQAREYWRKSLEVEENPAVRKKLEGAAPDAAPSPPSPETPAPAAAQ